MLAGVKAEIGTGGKWPNRSLIFIEILLGHVVFRHFLRLYWTPIGIRSIFHALQNVGLQGIPFFQQFFYAL